MLLLEHKGIDYERVVLPTGMHPLMLRLRGFSGNRPFREVDGGRPLMLEPADRMGTVPALKIDGQRVKTNRDIARFLEELRPDPPLYPGRSGPARARSRRPSAGATRSSRWPPAGWRWRPRSGAGTRSSAAATRAGSGRCLFRRRPRAGDRNQDVRPLRVLADARRRGGAARGAARAARPHRRPGRGGRAERRRSSTPPTS